MLVVDDDPGVRAQLRRHLEKMGVEVLEAGTGKAALSLLLDFERTPSLMCIDPVLPELSGYEICECIRSIRRLAEVPVLMISARTTPSDRALAEEVGATAYLAKPISWNRFSILVPQLLEGAEVAAARIAGEPANRDDLPGAHPGFHDNTEVRKDRRGER